MPYDEYLSLAYPRTLAETVSKLLLHDIAKGPAILILLHYAKVRILEDDIHGWFQVLVSVVGREGQDSNLQVHECFASAPCRRPLIRAAYAYSATLPVVRVVSMRVRPRRITGRAL